jgi:hypothetical protein
MNPVSDQLGESHTPDRLTSVAVNIANQEAGQESHSLLQCAAVDQRESQE